MKIMAIKIITVDIPDPGFDPFGGMDLPHPNENVSIIRLTITTNNLHIDWHPTDLLCHGSERDSVVDIEEINHDACLWKLNTYEDILSDIQEM